MTQRVNAIIAAGRAAAESLMVDTCTITRVTGQTLNESTGALTDTTTTVYTGKCRIQVRNFAIASQPQAGDREIVAMQSELQIPASAPALRVGDKATVTASQDSQAVGRVYRVRETFAKTHLTARRTVVQEEQT